MRHTVPGIHHITAVAGDPQANLDFYAGVLGLRFVKKTVNFDDPGTYHFYYGDHDGTPGTILTFFPWGTGSTKGREGNGQAVTVSFSVPAASFGFWAARLSEAGIPADSGERPADGRVLRFTDPDGLTLELVATPEETRRGYEAGCIPASHAIRGFRSVTLAEEDPESTARFLETALGFRSTGGPDDRLRFVAEAGSSGGIVDILKTPAAGKGTMGAGAVHHVAFRTADDETQAAFREQLLGMDVRVTPVADRQYFRSIYFREPGHVLFEIATDPPGFTADEPLEALGSSLRLPPWLERHAAAIESALPPVTVPPPYQGARNHGAA